MILKAIAEAGWFTSDFLTTSFSGSSGSVPLISPLSNGEGKKSTTASIINWTHLFPRADPHITGNKSPEQVQILIAFLSNSTGISSPSRYFSANSSS